jgi:hypothetical protein
MTGLPRPDPDVLPDEPDVYGLDVGGFVQRWLPGAFGDRTEIRGVFHFKVDEDSWETDEDGTIRRTIVKATVLPPGVVVQ